MAPFQDPARSLARHGLRPRKGLSQNFLQDGVVAQSIVDLLPKAPLDIVEIGAGTGVMTRRLVDSGRRVAAVELDPALVQVLRQDFEAEPSVEVVAGDAREVDLAGLRPPPYAVFGNIPYHLTGELIPRFMTLEPRPEWVVVLVQLEVAQRISAAPGDWSLATLGVRVHGSAELVLKVNRSAFLPVPKVDSGLVLLRPGATAEFATPEFFDFARAVFQERRKKLSNAVANALDHDVERGREVVGRAGLDEMRRPQTLDLSEWRRLCSAFEEVTG